MMLTLAELSSARPDLTAAGRDLPYRAGVALGRDGRYSMHRVPPPDDKSAFCISGRSVLVDDPILRGRRDPEPRHEVWGAGRRTSGTAEA